MKELLHINYNELLNRHRQGCVFCDPHPEIVIMEYKNFKVLVDVAPIVPGHLVIFSKDHYGCSGEVPVELFPELMLARNDVKQLLRQEYGSVMLYEHGRAGHCLTDGKENRLCHHFHLHVVPTNEDISEAVVKFARPHPINDYSQLPDLYERFGEYLYLQGPGGLEHFYSPIGEVPSHLLRTLLAQKVGFPDRADWTMSTSNDLLVTTLSRLDRYRMPHTTLLPTSSV